MSTDLPKLPSLDLLTTEALSTELPISPSKEQLAIETPQSARGQATGTSTGYMSSSDCMRDVAIYVNKQRDVSINEMIAEIGSKIDISSSAFVSSGKRL